MNHDQLMPPSGVPVDYRVWQSPRRPNPLRRLLFSDTAQSMTVAILLVGGLFLGAGAFVIIRYIAQPSMMFQPTKKMPGLPARKLEHHIRVKNFEQQSRRPMLMNKLASKAPGRIALPPLPPIKTAPADARSLPSFISPAGAHVGELGLGGFGIGSGKDAGLKGFSEVEFFGTKIATRSIIVLIDNSPSMRTRGVVATALAEMSNIVQRFHPDTQFNVIAYRDGADAFKPAMAFASQQDKQDFCGWMAKLQGTRQGEYFGNQKGTAGTTPLLALGAALALNPDTIIVLRDDQPPYADRDKSGAEARKDHARDLCAVVATHQRAASQRVTINTLLFKPEKIRNENEYKECADLLKKLASMTGGRYREIDAVQPPADAVSTDKKE